MSKSKGLPSLDQLANRIKVLPPNNSSSSDGSARPRLPLTSLRTSSTTSINTVASSADSMAVNPPATRSTSPSALVVDGSRSSTPSSDVAAVGLPGGDSSITADKLDKLQQQSSDSPTPSPPISVSSSASPAAPAPKKQVKGYKNIPSLDAITARLLKPKVPPQDLSIDGSMQPPDLPMIEDPKTPGLQVKPPEHPLQHPWTIYHDTKAKFPYPPAPGAASGGTGPAGIQSPATASLEGHFPPAPVDREDYEAGLTVIGTFTTVEQFCRYFNWLKPPSKLERNSNYHLFKEGIKPMWEDPANKDGGKWVLTMKNNPQLLDRCWSWVAMALVGEELEEDNDEICGAVVSLRSKVDRIQVWTRSKEDVERINGIGRKLVKLLDVGEKDGIGLEFQSHPCIYSVLSLITFGSWLSSFANLLTPHSPSERDHKQQYNTEDRPQPNKFLSIQSLPPTGFRSSFASPVQPTGGFGSGTGIGVGGFSGHGHGPSRSIGGGGQLNGLSGLGGGSDGQQQGPMSAGPGTTGGFSGGALGGWRK
ncbi:translation initiation factor eIF4e [Marasmius fiardii PR-910]|nr:translation initiation factor eIF4e [Marasmius fiardii PR-910]